MIPHAVHDNPMNQHAVSIAAVILPAASLWVRAAPVITDVAGLCGIIWYIYLGIKELHRHWKRKRPPR